MKANKTQSLIFYNDKVNENFDLLLKQIKITKNNKDIIDTIKQNIKNIDFVLNRKWTK